MLQQQAYNVGLQNAEVDYHVIWSRASSLDHHLARVAINIVSRHSMLRVAHNLHIIQCI